MKDTAKTENNIDPVSKINIAPITMNPKNNLIDKCLSLLIGSNILLFSDSELWL